MQAGAAGGGMSGVCGQSRDVHLRSSTWPDHTLEIVRAIGLLGEKLVKLASSFVIHAPLQSSCSSGLWEQKLFVSVRDGVGIGG